ncbi:MAG: hypothetical protein AB1442_17620 [Nitrospirota bacterium]
MKIPKKEDSEKCCELLRKAIQAHGGLEKWLSMFEFDIRARSGGIALPLRFQPAAFKSYRASISTTEPRTIVIPYPSGDQKGVFEGDTVKILDHSGQIIGERKNPRRMFKRLRRKFYWDDLDALYFGGYALWNYLNLPFLLAVPDIKVKEIEPWEENGKVLRRLHAVFPDDMPTHCKEQVFYFDSDYLLFRHDYTAEVFGTWAKAAHYSWNHKNFGGLFIPVRRRVYPRKSSGHPLLLITLVAIDIDEVRLIMGR